MKSNLGVTQRASIQAPGPNINTSIKNLIRRSQREAEQFRQLSRASPFVGDGNKTVQSNSLTVNDTKNEAIFWKNRVDSLTTLLKEKDDELYLTEKANKSLTLLNKQLTEELEHLKVENAGMERLLLDFAPKISELHTKIEYERNERLLLSDQVENLIQENQRLQKQITILKDQELHNVQMASKETINSQENIVECTTSNGESINKVTSTESYALYQPSDMTLSSLKNLDDIIHSAQSRHECMCKIRESFGILVNELCDEFVELEATCANVSHLFPSSTSITSSPTLESVTPGSEKSSSFMFGSPSSRHAILGDVLSEEAVESNGEHEDDEKDDNDEYYEEDENEVDYEEDERF